MQFITSVVFMALIALVFADGPVPIGITPGTGIPAGCVSTWPNKFTYKESQVISSGPMTTLPHVEGQVLSSLEDGILMDSFGRIGSIVANRQFQFDGPPQAGAIYTGGWGICPGEKILVLGVQKIFYACDSGSFANLYDQPIGEQCRECYLEVMNVDV